DDGSGKVRIGPPRVLRDSPAPHYCDIGQSGDGRRLVILIDGDEAAVVDLEQRSENVRIGSHPGMSNATISPDGRWVISGTQHGSDIKIWDGRSGRLLQDLPAGNYSTGIFSPDGKWLVTTS